MGKLNLIIDGNYILIKSVFMLFKSKLLYSELDTLLYKEVNKLSELYAFDNVYFATDSILNWRKKIYPEYKAKRVKSEDIDWDFVFKTYDEFKERLASKPNINLLSIPLAEGDDIIAYITKESNKLGYSNLIVSSDGDGFQLLDYDISDCWINIIYNNKKTDEKVFLPPNYKVFFSHADNASKNQSLFDDDDISEISNFLKHFIVKSKMVEKNKERSLFVKLVFGDVGDNIKSIYEGQTATGKPRGIGEIGAENLYDLYKETYPEDIDFFGDLFVNRLSELVCYVKKVNPATLDEVKSKVKNNIIFNMRLIVLDERYIPSDIYGFMRESIELV